MICNDCGYVLHQRAGKALDGQWAYVWANLRDEWVCPLTGNEHTPIPDDNMRAHWEIVDFGNGACADEHRWFTQLVARGDALGLGERECKVCGQSELWIPRAEEGATR